jgi:hypothetical protein
MQAGFFYGYNADTTGQKDDQTETVFSEQEIIKMKSEKGQAIVFLAFGFVAFLGFVALAIDGGMLYADRRHAQNGSDASSLAGGGSAALVLANNALDHPEVTYPDWICNSAWVNFAEEMGQNAAIARGGSNDFAIEQTLTQAISDTNNTYVATDCVNTDNGSYWDRWLDVTVNISDTTETSFAQMLFPDPLRNVVSATTRVYPKAPFGFGHAIIALREECEHNPNEGGAHFNGSGNVIIDGGGIFSNACLQTSGGTNNVVTVLDGENTCIPYDLNGNPTECWEDNGNPDFSPLPDAGNEDRRIRLSIPEPICNGPDHGKVQVNNNQVVTLDPGTYHEISVQGGELYLNPGLYCIIKPGQPNEGNGSVLFNGGIIEGPQGYTAGADDPFETGVSFFLDRGSFSTSGNATVRLTAAMQGSCEDIPCPGITHPSLTAVLIYMAVGNPNDVTLVGTGDDKFTGLVFVPSGTATLSGNGDTVSFNLQLIADTIKVDGNANININYDDSMQRWTSAMIELAR